ncbi:hypothetical protein PVAND_001274 [Polypedilum vanderplanki]|uniref:Uncharacterized protein n=1 Tax=Polypedilum vanderplanki TaxID=319348 RepID=A0A9J6BMV7_POLVA|nr:hypothetical protein PVAND_001274 [Polypedilum vanderplanki]
MNLVLFHLQLKKDMKVLLNVILLLNFATFSIASHESESDEHHHHHRDDEPFEYPCQNKFVPFKLDDAPAEFGVSAGEYKEGQQAYVGLFNGGFALGVGRIQISPPGFVFNGPNGFGIFFNDSSILFYLQRNKHHKYEWIPSQYGNDVPFAIDVGTEIFGDLLLFARIKIGQFIALGLSFPSSGNVVYVDGNNVVQFTSTNYEILTCKSQKKNETHIPLPKISMPGPTFDTGCINNWQPYKNDNAPSKNGISAGLHECGNHAYVGKGKISSWIPGRIQTVGKTGFYTMGKRSQAFLANGSYYLADNPNYTYYWQPFRGSLPNNAVQVRPDIGAITYPVIRVKIDGHVKIGYFVAPNSNGFFPSNDGTENEVINDFEFLVCDPVPKYHCEQKWKKYIGDNAPLVDGFPVSIYNTDTGSYIGRGTRKCINGCDYGLGKIQVTSPAGVYYLDDMTATQVFDNITAEYLVKNTSYTYEWVQSTNGVKVENALEVHKEGHRPFYIGITKYNYKVYIGKVRPGEGLYFIDPNGKQKVTSSYNVLTCTSPDASSHGHHNEDMKNWYSKFSCPKRMKWDYKSFKCVCDPEWKGLFKSATAKWNDEICSYVSI